MNKQLWLDLAESVDALRLVPRILILGFAIFAIDQISEMLDWYQGLPAAERAVEASGFAFLVIGTIAGLFTKSMDYYFKTGRKWNAPNSDQDS